MPDLANIFGRHEFAVRRLHSLVGLAPVGAFLWAHLITNVSILDGPKTFQQRVNQIHEIGPVTLEFVEWGFIFLPILFHALVGLVIVTRGQRNLFYYPYRENFRYTLERYTGVILFVFILWHVFHTRGWINVPWWLEHVTRPLGGGTFVAEDAAKTAVAGFHAALWVKAAYVVGTLCAVYHLSNGLWTAGITWGLWTTPRAQQWASLLALGLGLTLGAIGIGALVGLQVANVGTGEEPRMAKRPVMIVGGGLAGTAAAIKLAELECDVMIMSLTPLRRSHSCCAQGGINSVNDLTRQLGDNEWRHFEDTVYGGDFLQHQPPVKEMAYQAPQIIDLMDRLGVTFNRTPEGFRDQRRFGGTLFRRTAFAGATTGQQLLYALDEQVRRWEVAGKVEKFEAWDFLGPILDDHGVCRGCVAQDLVTMNVRAFPADAVVLATGGCGMVFGRSTNSVTCNGAAVSRAYRAGAWYGNGEFIQVHPTAIPGADKLRLISESARGEGGRIWVPRTPGDPRPPQDVPERERYYFLEDRYPTYGNLVPRDIATREIFKVCVEEGLSVQADRMCVYLDVTHLPRDVLDRKLAGVLEIYEKFQGVDPRTTPMKIFPGMHYSMGGLWCGYEANGDGGLRAGSPRNQQTNVPGLFAIGECEYQYHGANRLGANSLVACLFSGFLVAPGIVNHIDAMRGPRALDLPSALYDRAAHKHQADYKDLLARPQGGPNPYALHAELGELMTRTATVIRHNDELRRAYARVCAMQEEVRACAPTDLSNWTNQDVVFVRTLEDMLPLAKVILKGALERDECRGAHYKPEFAMPEITVADPAERRRQAEAWCDRFAENNRRWLKSTIAAIGPDGEPQISYEEVDTSLIAPRPRLYGVAGGEVIEEVWRERQTESRSGLESNR